MKFRRPLGDEAGSVLVRSSSSSSDVPATDHPSTTMRPMGKLKTQHWIRDTDESSVCFWMCTSQHARRPMEKASALKVMTCVINSTELASLMFAGSANHILFHNSN